MTDIELKFTDGATSVFLGNATSSTDGYIEEYHPTTPPYGATSHAESAKVTFTGSLALVEAAIAKINILATQARLYNATRLGGITWVQITIGSSVYTSQIFDIRFEPDDTAYRYEIAAGTRTGTLLWERMPFVEGAVTQIPLTNTNGSSDTAGLKVYSFDDSSTDATAYVKNNYMTLSAIDGDLPAPLRIELTAGASTTDALDDFVLAMNRNSGPTVLTYTFEGESGTGSSDLTSSTDVASAACSGGKYMSLVSSPTSAWIGQIYWNLDENALAYHKGNWFTPIIRWQAAPGVDISIKWKLETVSGIVMGESASINILASDTSLSTICPPIQVPPYVIEDDYADMHLQLYLYRGTTDATTLALDFVYLFCMDSIRVYTAIVTPAAGESVSDDGFVKRVYGTISSENSMTHSWTGDWIYAEPVKDNRLMYYSLTGTIAEFVTAKVYYRPRWRR